MWSSRRKRSKTSRPRFGITRYDIPINEYPCESTETGIRYSLAFEELEACNAAGLDMDKWMDGGYTVEKMVWVVAWHRMHNTIKNHAADAEIKASKQKAASEAK